MADSVTSKTRRRRMSTSRLDHPWCLLPFFFPFTQESIFSMKGPMTLSLSLFFRPTESLQQSETSDKYSIFLFQGTRQILKLFFLKKEVFGRHMHMPYFGTTGTCFGFLVISPLDFKARVILWRQMYCPFPEIHLWCYTLPTS